MNGRSQAIRLPKEFRFAGEKVRLTRVPGGVLISEADPWEAFEEACSELGESFFAAMKSRAGDIKQERDFTAGMR